MIVRDKLLWINDNKEGERCIFSFSKSIYDEDVFLFIISAKMCTFVHR